MADKFMLVLVGDSGVGKTALATRFVSQSFVNDYDPTIEDSYRKQVEIDGQSYILEILDTAGHEELTNSRDQGIIQGEGFLLVYSISSESSFSSIEGLHQHIKSVSSSPSLSNVPIILIGNKSDQDTNRAVSTQEGHALAQELGCEFVEVSAKENDNVEKTFYDIVRLLRRQHEAALRPMDQSRCDMLTEKTASIAVHPSRRMRAEKGDIYARCCRWFCEMANWMGEVCCVVAS